MRNLPCLLTLLLALPLGCDNGKEDASCEQAADADADADADAS